jgi:hypothetical protein
MVTPKIPLTDVIWMAFPMTKKSELFFPEAEVPRKTKKNICARGINILDAMYVTGRSHANKAM